ncbi:MAG TPA: universal stress protein [Candidatus Obscuribacterales bacterium]
MLKTIVIALDCSGLAEQVMQALQALVLQSSTKIVLAHVISPPEDESELAADQPHADFDPLPHRNLEKQLQSYQATLACFSEIEIVSGDPAEEIVRLANIYEADLIMIGSRGLTGLNRIIQGSVSSQVVESAPCSVWVIKPKF